jgi:hypothetical protein
LTTSHTHFFQEKSEIKIADNKAREHRASQSNAEFASVYTTPSEYPVTIKSIIKLRPIYKDGIDRSDKGVMEDYFFDYAIGNGLDGMLKNDVTIKLSDYPITPDFIYVDEENEKFFVIEIDEPYSISDCGEFILTHCNGCDDERNQALLNLGWGIIRFAEEQIAKHPVECVKFIADFINCNCTIELNTISSWTNAEAQKMIEQKYRDSYLPESFRGTSRSDSGLSYRSFEISNMPKVRTLVSSGHSVIYLKNPTSANAKEIEYWYEGYIYDEIITKINGAEDFTTNIEPNWIILTFKWVEDLYRFEGLGRLNLKDRKVYFNLMEKKKFKIIPSGGLIEILKQASNLEASKKDRGLYLLGKAKELTNSVYSREIIQSYLKAVLEADLKAEKERHERAIYLKRIREKK